MTARYYLLLLAVFAVILWGGYELICGLAGNPLYPFGMVTL